MAGVHSTWTVSVRVEETAVGHEEQKTYRMNFGHERTVDDPCLVKDLATV